MFASEKYSLVSLGWTALRVQQGYPLSYCECRCQFTERASSESLPCRLLNSSCNSQATADCPFLHFSLLLDLFTTAFKSLPHTLRASVSKYANLPAWTLEEGNSVHYASLVTWYCSIKGRPSFNIFWTNERSQRKAEFGHYTRFSKRWPLSSAAHLSIVLVPVYVGMGYITFEIVVLSDISKSCIYRAPSAGNIGRGPQIAY